MPTQLEPMATAGIYQVMTESDADKAARLYAMASNLRHSAAETGLPAYRTRLLNVARDLEGEAARLEGHSAAIRPSKDSFRPR